MTDESTTGDGGDIEKRGSVSEVKTLEALTDRPLTASEYKALEVSESLSGVSPLVEDTGENTVNGISLVVEDVYSYYVWNPDAGQWEQVVRIDTTGDGEWGIEAVEVVDDESGDVEVGFSPSQETVLEDVYDHIRAYTEHVYGDMDGLWFIPDDLFDRSEGQHSIGG